MLPELRPRSAAGRCPALVWFNPAGVPDLSGRGGESVLLSMFEPKGANDNGDGGQRQAPRQQPPMDDDIPF